MKAKLLTLCLFFAVTAMALSPISYAYVSVSVIGYTDKLYYRPGESGTINFWLYNTGNEPAILNNVTIFYPWDTSGFWGTNQTIDPTADVVIPANGGNWSSTTTFTIPNDARSTAGSASFSVDTDKGHFSGSVPISLQSTTPFFMALENMTTLTTVLTLLAVFVLIVGVIIALAIWTSKRHAMWKSEPNPP